MKLNRESVYLLKGKGTKLEGLTCDQAVCQPVALHLLLAVDASFLFCLKAERKGKSGRVKGSVSRPEGGGGKTLPQESTGI